MTNRLTPGPRVAGWRTAALIETRREISGRRHGAWVRASVAPVAVILVKGGDLRAFDVTGRALAPAALEDLQPGLAGEIAALD